MRQKKEIILELWPNYWALVLILRKLKMAARAGIIGTEVVPRSRMFESQFP